MSLLKYGEILSSLQKKKRNLNLLMGNGFSIAFDKNIFSYNALHYFVENTNDSLLKRVFDVVKTKNFEIVMQRLGNFCELLGFRKKLVNISRNML